MNKHTIFVVTLISLLAGGSAFADGMRASNSGRQGGAPMLAPGEKWVFVSSMAQRSVDTQGNSLIQLTDSRKIRLLRNGQVEILNPSDQVVEHGGQFARWVGPSGRRAGSDAGRASSASRHDAKRASPLIPAGQYLIYR